MQNVGTDDQDHPADGTRSDQGEHAVSSTGEQQLRNFVESFNKYYATGDAREHAYRPPLATLVEALAGRGVVAVNDPKRVKCGAPDFVISQRTSFGHLTIGHIETKDVTVPLDSTEKTDQLRRYLGSLDNLVLTNYIDFRWYVGGKRRLSTSLGHIASGHLVVDTAALAATHELLSGFLAFNPQPITKPRELAEHMAKLTHIIRDIVIQAFETGEASDLLRGWRQAFAQVLIAGLDQPDKTAEFADMFAQTLSYGLFSARVMDVTEGFTRDEAMRLVPRTNPFLRKFFGHIAGPEMDDEPYAGFVDDVVSLLANADMPTILADFGTRTKQEDPVVHFYETFLAAYDPKLREARGVYFTPEPVVGYIVRSVDHILKTVFGLPMGLADHSMVTVPNRDPGNTVRGTNKARKTDKVHRVLLLDPAVGTATFPYAVIDLIRRQFMATGSAGMWSSYVREHLLPRIFGFELLMAPYAVAHFKLGLQLAGHDLPQEDRDAWAYDFATNERIGVFLTNTLEPPHEHTGLPLFTQFVADETDAADEVKQSLPIMVVMGNPPYSNFGGMNRNRWIAGLLDDYKRDLHEKKINLDDDFIKFIRFGQWRVERSGCGVLAFITSNTYLDGITHRRMRQSLLGSFDEIYILNLHGNSRKGELTPEGDPDENVFDIQQGVAVGIFIRKARRSASPAVVRYSELYGARALKYEVLSANDLSTTQWTTLDVRAPSYYFVPTQYSVQAEYEQGHRLTDIFVAHQNGVKTDRDRLFVDFDLDRLRERMRTFYSAAGLDHAFATDYRIENSSSYDILARRQRTQYSDDCLHPFHYRPFDQRWLYYSVGLTSRPAFEVMQHMVAGQNLALIATRQTSDKWDVLCGRGLIGHKSCAAYDINSVFPLWLYDDAERPGLDLGLEHNSRSNVSPTFLAMVRGSLGAGVSEVDVFHYIYAVLYSPEYRRRYSELLRSDYPRIPLTSNESVFHRLVALGSELVAAHLLESPALLKSSVAFPRSGMNVVAKGFPRYAESTERVNINVEQYFEGVTPDVWQYCVGGYQVCHKWLKDRQGRQLSFNDLQHYQRMVRALQETIRIMGEIDSAIPEWPMR